MFFIIEHIIVREKRTLLDLVVSF